MFIADTLSRAHIDETSPAADVDDDYEVLTVQPVASHLLEELRQETVLDLVMKNLASTILYEWPKNQDDVHPDIKPYFNIN